MIYEFMCKHFNFIMPSALIVQEYVLLNFCLCSKFVRKIRKHYDLSLLNRYVDLLLGEFKHYKTRLVHGGIRKEVKSPISILILAMLCLT